MISNYNIYVCSNFKLGTNDWSSFNKIGGFIWTKQVPYLTKSHKNTWAFNGYKTKHTGGRCWVREHVQGLLVIIVPTRFPLYLTCKLDRKYYSLLVSYRENGGTIVLRFVRPSVRPSVRLSVSVPQNVWHTILKKLLMLPL